MAIRFAGVGTGMDIDGLVSSLMSLERRPVTLLEAKQDKLNTQAGAWRDLNSRLLNLQSRLAELRKLAESDWDGKKATVSDQTVLTASASSGALAGTYQVEVLTLAKATTWQSGLSVADAKAQQGLVGTITVSGGVGNGKTIDIVAEDSLATITDKINKKSSELGFSASVIQTSPGDHRLVLTGTKGGATNHFELTGAVATSLQLDSGSAAPIVTAADGQIKVNNVAITVADNAVSGVVPGLTLNLLKAGASTTVSVTEDNQKIVDAVKGFVDQYNSVVDFISQKTKYDDKAKKAGDLFGEGMLTGIRSSLSTKAFSAVSSLAAEFNSLGMVGISTEKYSKTGGVSGKLAFDQKKFTEALDKDPSAVRQLFTLEDGANEGVAVRLEKWLQSYTQTGGLVLGKAKSLDDQVKDIKDRIKYMDEVVLPQREERLRKQFSQMEKAMASFQNQSTWLSGQLSSLSYGYLGM